VIFLWIGFWLSCHHFCKVTDFSEPIKPCWESKRTC
jgi:hypothetical protein